MTSASGRREGDGGTGGKQASTWLIIGAVVVVLVLAFWLYDAFGADLMGDDTDSLSEQDAEEDPDADFGEPADGEGPEVEPVP